MVGCVKNKFLHLAEKIIEVTKETQANYSLITATEAIITVKILQYSEY